MPPRRLLLITPAELTRDTRARRAAVAAQERGFEVIGLCGQVSGLSPVPLEGVAVTRAGRRRGAHGLWGGATGGRAPRSVLRELRGLYRIARLVARSLQLWRAARDVHALDVVHANDLDTLLAGVLIARRNRARLVYDAHELYSAFEADPPPFATKLAVAFERALARHADAILTVSEPIARELRTLLRLPADPLVVLNAPPRVDAPIRTFEQGPLRVVYQGGLGPGRSLEDVLDAAKAEAAVELTLRIPLADPRRLREAVARRGLERRVRVLEPVAPDDVLDALREFEIGLIFDRPHSRNGELSLPNKFFEYLMAGLAVVTPRLEALAPIVEGRGVGVTYDAQLSGALGAAVAELARDRGRVAKLRERARAAALDEFNAERQAPVLAQAWGINDGG